MRKILGLSRRCNPDENLIPSMMLTRRSVTVSGKTLLQHFAVLHFGNIEETPARKATVAPSANLVTEQPNDPALDTVIMRLSYALLTLVCEPEQMFLCDRFSD